MTLGELVYSCNDDVIIHAYQQTDNPMVTQTLYEGSKVKLFSYEFYEKDLSMTVLLWYIKTDFLGVNTLYVNVY